MIKKLCTLFLFIFMFALLFSCRSKFKPESKIDKFYNYPNPFNSRKESTTYKLILKDTDIEWAKVQIYGSDASLITSFDLVIDSNDKKIALATWVGTDENGDYLPAYVYDVMIKVRDVEGNIYTGSTKTVLR